MESKMSQPAAVRLKRKRSDDAPDFLILEAPSENPATKKLRYVRHAGGNSAQEENGQAKAKQSEQQLPSVPATAEQNTAPARREFRLNRKRKGDDEGVATFVEKRVKSSHHAAKRAGYEPQSHIEPASSPLKKPSKRAAVKITPTTKPQVETAADRERMEELAGFMHQAALDEIEREQIVSSPATHSVQHKQVTPPKLSDQRSREIHRRRTATNGSIGARRDHDMDDESDYVYDTYILAPSSKLGAAQIEVQNGLDNVGYLVITEEDESVWETYLEDEPSDKDWNTDEDDENAEDYYGADYPEDELQSDDEFDRSAYGYRAHGGSDDEQWDEDTGTYSDQEFERMMNPFAAKNKTKQFATYMEHEGDSD